MATRSTIAVEHNDGKVSEIYCHYDGYPEHNGRILIEQYTTLEKVEELISHGDLSVLAPNINPIGSHSFEHPEDDVCIFYGRDRGETDINPSKHSNLEMYRLSGVWQEYNYLFKDGNWYLVPNKSSKELVSLMSIFVAE